MSEALLLIVMLAGGPLREQRVLVDPATAASRAWDLTGGAHDGRPVADPERPDATVLALPYDLTEETTRAAWDIPITESVVGAGNFACEVYLDRPELMTGVSVYFRAGEGWYGAWFGADLPDAKPGWRSLRWSRAQMKPEDPGRWSECDAVRVSIWQAKPGAGTLWLRPVTASASSILLVSPRWWEERGGEDGEEAQPWMSVFAEALTAAGTPFGEVDDVDLDAETLSRARILLFPYAPELSPELLAALPGFVAAGGRIVACYSIPTGLAQTLNLGPLDYTKPESSDLVDIVFDGDQSHDLPPAMAQDSWNAVIPTAPPADCEVIGRWRGSNGLLGAPACLRTAGGVWFGHVLTGVDRDATAQCLLGILGSLAPEVWEAAYEQRRDGFFPIGPFANEAELADAVRASGVTDAAEQLEAALAHMMESRTKGDAGLWREALAALQPVRKELVEAWACSLAPREGEFRAAWCHDAFGIGTRGWPATIDALKSAGFTAVVPNMLWGGVAYYPSVVLPVAAEVAEKGDQIDQCLTAAHERGIEVHVWKVNWCLGPADATVVEALRQQGRLQLSPEGKEVTDPFRWLCPSDETNFAAERDSMLEIARNYAVDGLHFDYIRYPSEDGCYCPRCRALFEAGLGRPVSEWPADVTRRDGRDRQAWLEYRRQRIDRLVEAVATEAREIRPGIKISAAVWPDLPRTRDSIGQDWVRWIDRGWLDFVCPMAYTRELEAFRGMVNRQREWVGGRIPVYPGIGCHEATPDGFLAQIAATREAGSSGFIVFNLDEGLAREYLPLAGLGATRAY